MSPRSAVARLAASPHEAIWLARHAMLLMLLPVMIRTLPLRQLLRLLTPSDAQQPSGRGQAPDADRIVALTDALLRRISATGRGYCLKRSLALYRALRRAGVPVEFCLGVRRQPGAPASQAMLHGHAWLACGATVLYEESSHLLSVYAETYRYPSPAEPGDSKRPAYRHEHTPTR